MMKPNSPDEYLATLPEDQCAALQRLRATIRSIAPEAQEGISSGVPAFRHRGRYLVSFGAAKRHVSLYVMQGDALHALRDELTGYDTSNTVVRFAPERLLPPALVGKIVRHRIHEIDAVLDG